MAGIISRSGTTMTDGHCHGYDSRTAPHLVASFAPCTLTRNYLAMAILLRTWVMQSVLRQGDTNIEGDGRSINKIIARSDSTLPQRCELTNMNKPQIVNFFRQKL